MQVYDSLYRNSMYMSEYHAPTSAEEPSGDQSEAAPYTEYRSYVRNDARYHSRSNPFNRENFLSGEGMYAGQLTRLLSPSIASMMVQEQVKPDKYEPAPKDDRSWMTDIEINTETHPKTF